MSCSAKIAFLNTSKPSEMSVALYRKCEDIASDHFETVKIGIGESVNLGDEASLLWGTSSVV